MNIRLSVILILFVLLAACAPNAPATTSANPTVPNLDKAQGTARLSNRNATADQFVVQLTGVPAAPSGFAYNGWLVSDDGATVTNVGTLKVAADQTARLEWIAPGGDNLLARYSRFQVTLEPTGERTKPSGKPVMAGGFNADALANARRLFVRNVNAVPVAPAPTPQATVEKDPYGYDNSSSATSNVSNVETAVARGLREQVELEDQHAQNAVNAAAIGSLDQLRAHLEHIVNIYEGVQGARFGDYDGNGRAENPGDGVGVRGYVNEILEYTENLSNHAAMQTTAQKLLAQMSVIEDKAIALQKTTDPATAASALKELKSLSDGLNSGLVADLYQGAQEALVFAVTPVK